MSLKFEIYNMTFYSYLPIQVGEKIGRSQGKPMTMGQLPLGPFKWARALIANFNIESVEIDLIGL